MAVDPSSNVTIAKRIRLLQEEIIDALRNYGSKDQQVQLIAASKTRGVDDIKAALAAGVSAFGENYLQEALPKIQALANQGIEWHFIGPIQANKTKAIAENFSWVHSVCRYKIAKRLSEQRPAELPPLNICIEVNISHADTKAGVSLAELPQLAAEIIKLPNIKLQGLMAIPEPESDFAKQRKIFAKLRLALTQLAQNGVELQTLSMGMSGDFVAAIAEGATMIRIGTGIFGPRV